MRRYRLGFLLLLVLAVLGAALGGVWWSLAQVPEFYVQATAAKPDASQRKRQAKEFVQRTLRLVDDIQHAETWSEEFTNEQINSWLAEELHAKFGRFVPEGVRDPRVRLAGGVIEVGFQYEGEAWNGVVSLALRPWVCGPNQLAFELRSVRAGVLPIPWEELLDDVSSGFEAEGWLVERTQSDGNDTFILHLDPYAEHASVLDAVQVAERGLLITGHARDWQAAEE